MNTALSARQIVLSGQVQGVGFRPFIYRIATKHKLTGWVRNCVGIVEIHVQGQSKDLKNFVSDIFAKKPPLAKPELESDRLADIGEFDSFSILQSQSQGDARISVPTDLFLCDDCLAELNDPSDRRYRYPFINCTQCGPRYTLIKSLPYDRPNTTMAGFELCPSCLAEYEDPNDRRFHAEPIACPACGPSLSFNHDGEISNHENALNDAVDILHQGKVVAVKGIGGYHLMCDAGSEEAVCRLRKNKPRAHKPLAIIFPAPADNPFVYAEKSLTLSEDEKRFLLQPARPILLVKKNQTSQLCEQISPGLNEVGMMLPYSPLHHLLLNEFGGPLVATSANISGEPVLIDNQQVEKRLAHVADACLHHNRPIERPADDPVYRSIAGKARPIRTGRGSAPIELTLPFELEQPILAVGAQMKNVITLAWDNRAVISPHIGEMDSVRSLEVFENTINDLQRLYGVKAKQIISDAHPGYTTTRWAHKCANEQNLPVHNVYHHHAHASAAYYECQRAVKADEPILVFAWDGVGYGEDGTLWGGETFLGKPGAWQRVASMKPFNLPGGDKAGRQPWRSAAAVCWEVGLDYDALDYNKPPEKDPMLHQMLHRTLKRSWQQQINAPQTTSVGRLFDAAAALTGVRTNASFEGQGPMEFEALCDGLGENTAELTGDYIELNIESGSQDSDNLLILDWKLLIQAMLDSTLSVKARAILFHNSLAYSILKQAQIIREKHDVSTVSFSGGVFQNRVLTEKAIALLSADGFEVCLPELIPVNDAGISFGQVMEYGYKTKCKKLKE
ncbi:MAG: carbamoyltransferase HypF [Gammaproteobacteria bacterium]|nr:carbamoyltransferase HypF [Gammaproteobacteria bacterium]